MECYWNRCHNEAVAQIAGKPVCDERICQMLLKWGMGDDEQPKDGEPLKNYPMIPLLEIDYRRK